MAQRNISLSPLVVDYLCERLDITLHPLLRTARFGQDDEERSRARGLALEEMRSQGLAERDDVHPFVDEVMHLLAKPPLAVGVATQTQNGENFNAVLIERGRSVVQAYQPDGETPEEAREIKVVVHEYGGLPWNTVSLLPKSKGAQGMSVSMPAEVLQQAAERAANKPSEMRGALTSLGIRSAEASALAQAFAAERVGGGQITVRGTDKLGRGHKLPTYVQYFDTKDGRYMTQSKPGHDGRDWFLFVPADEQKIAAKVDEMLRTFVSPTGR